MVNIPATIEAIRERIKTHGRATLVFTMGWLKPSVIVVGVVRYSEDENSAILALADNEMGAKSVFLCLHEWEIVT